MKVRRSESGFYVEPVGPGRRATARLRRACGAAHSRAAVDPTETALNPLASSRQDFSPPRSIETLRVRNLTQNRRKIFHLNCVPRQNSYHFSQVSGQASGVNLSLILGPFLTLLGVLCTRFCTPALWLIL
jgi:hypothetical protein